jgi:predicted small integral membrane protein
VLAIRFAKICCVGAMAFYVALVAFNNVTDYETNFVFVTHVLDMDDVPPESHIRWRTISSPALHHASYLLIIATELAVAWLCGIGAYQMARARRAKAAAFNEAKTYAVLGLALGFLLYEAGFIAVGGEWFGMWQSQRWDGVPSAFRIAVTLLGTLIFISLKDEDSSA